MPAVLVPKRDPSEFPAQPPAVDELSLLPPENARMTSPGEQVAPMESPMEQVAPMESPATSLPDSPPASFMSEDGDNSDRNDGVLPSPPPPVVAPDAQPVTYCEPTFWCSVSY